MSNLNTPAIYTGPLTASDLADWRESHNCCNGNCAQGRQCPMRNAAEACTEVGHEDDDFGAFYGLKSAVLITAGIACIAFGVHLLVQAVPHIF